MRGDIEEKGIRNLPPPKRAILETGNGATTEILDRREGYFDEDGNPIEILVLNAKSENFMRLNSIPEKEIVGDGFIILKAKKDALIPLNRNPAYPVDFYLYDFYNRDTPISLLQEHLLSKLATQNSIIEQHRQEIGRLRDELKMMSTSGSSQDDLAETVSAKVKDDMYFLLTGKKRDI